MHRPIMRWLSGQLRVIEMPAGRAASDHNVAGDDAGWGRGAALSESCIGILPKDVTNAVAPPEQPVISMALVRSS